jgi:hypothetical protein
MNIKKKEQMKYYLSFKFIYSIGKQAFGHFNAIYGFGPPGNWLAPLI